MASEDNKKIMFVSNFFLAESRRRRVLFPKLFVNLCLIFLFLSCQTIPPAPEAYLEQGVLPLDKGALVYLVADVKEARGIINQMPIKEIDDRNVRQMINRSNFAMVAVFPEQSGRRFQIAAWGNYPKSGAGMALGANKNWVKRRNEAGVEYWHSAADRLSLAVTAKNLFAVSSLNAAPANPFASGAETPEGFTDFSRGAVLSCWVSNPAEMFRQILSKAGVPLTVPVRQLFINLNSGVQSNKQYEAVLRLGLENATQARGLAAIMRVAGAFTSDDPDLQTAMLLLSNPSVQNGRNLDIKINFSSEEEIISFINSIAGSL